jgi:RimJ/RimL family protein N-acetyltransferase
MTVVQATDYLASHSVPSRHIPGTWRQLAIAELTSDALVGDMGVWLSEDGLKAEVGLSITPFVQGKGYGSESLSGLIGLLFASTQIMEIEASTDIRNLPCLAALRRARFSHVDTRQAEYKGELCTELVFVAHRGEG